MTLYLLRKKIQDLRKQQIANPKTDDWDLVDDYLDRVESMVENEIYEIELRLAQLKKSLKDMEQVPTTTSVSIVRGESFHSRISELVLILGKKDS